jgi:hypothetical protein
LVALGAFVISHGGTGRGLLLCAIGAVMLGKRFFVS